MLGENVLGALSHDQINNPWNNFEQKKNHSGLPCILLSSRAASALLPLCAPAPGEPPALFPRRLLKKLARTSAFLAFGSAPGAPGVAAVVRAARELAVVRVLVGSRAGLARGSLALEPAVLRGLLLVAVLVLAAEEDRGERGA